MKISFRHILPLLATALLCSCATSTVKQTWKSPAVTGAPVKKIAVLAVDERGMVRQAFENRFVGQLRDEGQEAIFTHGLLTLEEIKADKAASAKALTDAGADAILIVRLTDSATHGNQIRANPAVFVSTVDGFESYDWYDYYNVSFTDMGTIWGNMRQNVFLESSLFDLKTGKRLWACTTQTVLVEGHDRVEVLDPLVKKIIAALRRDGLVR